MPYSSSNCIENSTIKRELVSMSFWSYGGKPSCIEEATQESL